MKSAARHRPEACVSSTSAAWDPAPAMPSLPLALALLVVPCGVRAAVHAREVTGRRQHLLLLVRSSGRKWDFAPMHDTIVASLLALPRAGVRALAPGLVLEDEWLVFTAAPLRSRLWKPCGVKLVQQPLAEV